MIAHVSAQNARRRSYVSTTAGYQLPYDYQALKREPVIAAGEYDLEIVGSDYVPNHDVTGMVMRLCMQMTDCPWPAVLFTIDMTLEHDDATVQETGQRDFTALRHAIGVTSPTDTAQLHFRAFRATVGQRQDTAGYGTENFFIAFYGRPEPRAAA